RRPGRPERRRGEGQRGMDRRREPRRRAVPTDVHVHDPRRFVQDVVMQRGLLDPTLLELAEDRADLAFEQHEVAHQHRLGVAHLLERDRKSTRLNSSHVKISYAVFCLKKKKKQKNKKNKRQNSNTTAQK